VNQRPALGEVAAHLSDVGRHRTPEARISAAEARYSQQVTQPGAPRDGANTRDCDHEQRPLLAAG